MQEVDNRLIFANNLNYYLNAQRKTQIEVANALSIKPSTFSSWCTGQKMPRMDKIELLSKYFGILKSDLIEDKTNNKVGTPYIPTHRIPILGRISAGLPLYAEEHIEGYTYTDLNHDGEYFALRVSGDSMNAINIHEGNILIVRKQDSVENGSIAVVLVDGQDATVKRFYQSGRTVTLLPQSTNSDHAPQIYDLQKTDIRVLGKVVENKILFE